MPVDYNARKAAQAIAYLASKSAGSHLHVVKAVKLVYLADRDSIAQYGFPIIDDDRVSMPHGPVNSMTYSHINGEYDLNSSGWSEFLYDRANHQIAARKNFSLASCDELSEADVASLDRTWKKFGHMDEWDLRDWTHVKKNLPEWENPRGSSNPIPLERIMSALGIENGEDQAAVVEEHRSIDRFFRRLRT